MIVFINFSGGPRGAIGGLLLCLLLNFGFDYLTSTPGSFVWLELAASALGMFVAGLVLVLAFKVMLNPRALDTIMQSVATRFGTRAAAGANTRGQQREVSAERLLRWERVVRALQRLPTETVATPEELQRLSAHELKERLIKAGGSCDACLEKAELVRALLEVGGSSGGSCCICCEDYTAGDVLRVLPCKHRFHIECVDRWFLSSTDYSRPPACPMCNAELLS